MQQYHNLLQEILTNGVNKEDRTGTGTKSIFGYQMRFNLKDGFPIVTTKNVSFKNIVVELLWFLRGDNNIKYMVDNGCNIWSEDAYNFYKKRYSELLGGATDYSSFEEFVAKIKRGATTGDNIDYQYGDTGEQYPKLWRHWKKYGQDKYGVFRLKDVDQISDLISGLKNNPFSRRHILTAWNPATLDGMALNACHAMVQFNVRERVWRNTDEILRPYDLRPSEVSKFISDNNFPKYYLDCQLYQRSGDAVLGVPYNIASYALLTHILCKICNMIPGEFIHTLGDAHIYSNHIDAAKEQLERDPEKYWLPTLMMLDEFHYLTDTELVGELSVDDIISKLRPDMFTLENYQHYPKLQNETKLNTGLR